MSSILNWYCISFPLKKFKFKFFLNSQHQKKISNNKCTKLKFSKNLYKNFKLRFYKRGVFIVSARGPRENSSNCVVVAYTATFFWWASWSSLLDSLEWMEPFPEQHLPKIHPTEAVALYHIDLKLRISFGNCIGIDEPRPILYSV